MSIPKLAFITHGSIMSHATLKRATGLAVPLRDVGIRPILILQESPDNRARVAVEAPGADVRWFPTGSAIQERRAKERILSEVSPDFVWVCAPGVRNWVRMSSRVRRPWRIADHSEVLSGIPDRPLWRRFYDGILERLFARGFDAHVCSSRYLFDYYGKLTSARAVPLLYLPYAFSPHEARAAVADVAAIHSRYGGRKIVLYAGTLSENYGILDLIRAVATLARSRNDFVGVFAGRGHVAERAKSLVTEIGLQDRVFLPGYVNDSELAALMASASAFVCPLRDTIQDWARCPSKLYLYLSHRKPVVTSRIGEAIQIFGDNGLYFEPKNVASMAEKISEALDYTGSDLPDPALHSWEARARTTLKWLQANLPQAFSK